MIIGIGTDIVNIGRIEKSREFLQHFKRRILGTLEVAEIKDKIACLNNKEYACLLAKYFAAKEAFVKAVGTGFRDGIFMRDIQILHNELGKPYVSLSGEAKDALHKCSGNTVHVSLSDDYPWAQAFVIVEQI